MRRRVTPLQAGEGKEEKRDLIDAVSRIDDIRASAPAQYESAVSFISVPARLKR